MMDSSELEAAVKAGVITPEVACNLRNFSAEQRHAPLADEEKFGLVGGLADVMTAAGLLLLLGGVAFAFSFLPPVAITIVLGASWAFAEHFTRQRKMTLTSFVLFFTFVMAALVGLLGVVSVFPMSERYGSLFAWGLSPLAGLVVAFGTAMICVLYWLRFKLPFAYMAAAVAAVNAGTHVVQLAVPNAAGVVVSFMMLLIGLLLFAVAMWWDMSDIRRETRRADIAFWMHWAAGYQIASASFRLLLGANGPAAGWERLYAVASPADGFASVAVLCLFAFFCFVALIIDRRSLLMSSLIYVVPATAHLIGALESTTMTLTAMLTGGFLVVLAAYWRTIREMLLATLPDHIRAQLPRTDLAFATARPVA